jgi:predicted Ser/Thr protein kinase
LGVSQEYKIKPKKLAQTDIDEVKGKHIAPHTIEIAAMWAVLTKPANTTPSPG